MTNVSLDGEDRAKFWKSSGFGVKIRNGSVPDSPWRRDALSEWSCYRQKYTIIYDLITLQVNYVTMVSVFGFELVEN